MKVAVSIPDQVFDDAEVLAKQLNIARSRLYARALDAFVANHAPDRVTVILDALADTLAEGPDNVTRAAAKRVFDRTEW